MEEWNNRVIFDIVIRTFGVNFSLRNDVGMWLSMLNYQMSSDPPGGSQGFGARPTWIDIGSGHFLFVSWGNLPTSLSLHFLFVP